MRGTVSTGLLFLGFQEIRMTCEGMIQFFDCWLKVEDILLAIQKLLDLREAAQEVLASPDGSAVIKPPAEWPT